MMRESDVSLTRVIISFDIGGTIFLTIFKSHQLRRALIFRSYRITSKASHHTKIIATSVFFSIRVFTIKFVHQCLFHINRILRKIIVFRPIFRNDFNWKHIEYGWVSRTTRTILNGENRIFIVICISRHPLFLPFFQ